MPKLTGVVVAAVLIALVAFIGTWITVDLFAQSTAGANHSALVAYLVAVAFIGMITVMAWCVAAGLFRGARWARIGCIVLGSITMLLGLLCGFGVIAGLLRARGNLSHSASQLPALGLFFFLLTVMGGWLLVYFNTPSVTQAFRDDVVLYVPDTLSYAAEPSALRPLDAMGQPTPAMPAHGYAAIPRQMQRPREALSVDRVIVVFAAIFFLLESLTQIRNVIFQRPFFYFGLTLRGHASLIALLIDSALLAATAVGLLRRIAVAYYVALFFTTCTIVSQGLLLSPSYRTRAVAARAAYTMRVRSHHWATATWVINFLFYACIYGVILWALWRDLNTIRQQRARPVELNS